MSGPTEIEAKSKKWSEYFQIAGLAIGAIAIAVSVFLSARTEQQKALAIRYLSQLSLISPAAQRTGDLRVIVDQKEVKAPRVVSARFENIGNVAVEKRDIEKHLTLEFQSASVLGVEIRKRNPQNLEVVSVYDEKKVVFKHGLMNSGDWFTFDVLLDGEPDWPKASFRISGVQSPIITFPLEREAVFYATLFLIPTPIQYTILGIVYKVLSVVAIWGIAAFFLGAQIFDSLRVRPGLSGLCRSDECRHPAGELKPR